MSDPPGTPSAPLLDAIPPAALALAERLHGAGHEAFLVGGCVRDALREAPIHDVDLATSAQPAQVLDLFPRAVPTGLRHGTVMVPTDAGPVDVTTYRAGTSLAADLAHRDFTLNAMALDPRAGTLVDPHGGRGDLQAGCLRAVGRAADRLAEDPLRALRAARLVATLGVAADAELTGTLPGAREGLATVARERVRAELEALLLGAQAGRGLALLLDTGLLEALFRGVRKDVPAVVAALPASLLLRFAALLRGTRVSSILATLRVPRRHAQRVSLLLRCHPIEGSVDPESDTSVRRLLQRVGEANFAELLALRRAELAVDANDEVAKALLRIEQAVVRVQEAGALALHRLDLALDGREVMAALGTRPGRLVGAALAYLTERVLEDPRVNTPEGLRTLLTGFRP